MTQQSKIKAMLERKQEQKDVVKYYIAGDISDIALEFARPFIDSIYEDIKELEDILEAKP